MLDPDPDQEQFLAPLRDAPWLRVSDRPRGPYEATLHACDEREYLYLRRCREALKDLVNAAAATPPHLRGLIDFEDAERALEDLPRKPAGAEPLNRW